MWHDALAAWMVENDITDSFYWCLNPNSGARMGGGVVLSVLGWGWCM